MKDDDLLFAVLVLLAVVLAVACLGISGVL